MAQRVQVILEDDHDGGIADETIEFALDGATYEIDLSRANAQRLREAIAPWREHARTLRHSPNAPTIAHEHRRLCYRVRGHDRFRSERSPVGRKTRDRCVDPCQKRRHRQALADESGRTHGDVTGRHPTSIRPVLLRRQSAPTGNRPRILRPRRRRSKSAKRLLVLLVPSGRCCRSSICG